MQSHYKLCTKRTPQQSINMQSVVAIPLLFQLCSTRYTA